VRVRTKLLLIVKVVNKSTLLQHTAAGRRQTTQWGNKEQSRAEQEGREGGREGSEI
jgi:hypothetical protein